MSRSQAAVVHLRRERDKSLRQGHPWLFSGAIESIDGAPEPGATVDIVDAEGAWLARAAFAPSSRIACRVWTFDPDEVVDESFVEKRVAAALDRRRDVAADDQVTAYREVHAESDLLPGVIVDRYGDLRVIQLLTPGADRLREALVEILRRRGDGLAVYERSDVDARAREGLPPRVGALWGDAPQERRTISEYGLSFEVDVVHGHKTGFYLDQRENRRRASVELAGSDVLDAFCYTGGFGVAALRAGARRLTAIDSSASALALARRNVERNGGDPAACEFISGDAFVELRRLRDQGRSFDVIVLDPPRFAPTVAQVQRAARGYKDINLLALKLLRPGGRLMTFSCSGGVGPELFEQIVCGAALDAGAPVTIEAWLGQPADHPVGAHFPEGRYLKGLICRKGEGRWYPAPHGT